MVLASTPFSVLRIFSLLGISLSLSLSQKAVYSETKGRREEDKDGNGEYDNNKDIQRNLTTYLAPPSTGDWRRLSGTLVLALGLKEVLPLEFCEVCTALPDALLPVGVELTVEAMGLGVRQSKRAHVVKQDTTRVCAMWKKGSKKK